MYRRIVSLLLLPCMLLTQSVAFSHCHNGSQPAGHELCAHFHTRHAIVGSSHDHGHHHGSGHHHHHKSERDSDSRPEKQPPSQPEPLTDHDSDAVYIGSFDAVIRVSSSDAKELTTLSLADAVGSNSAALDSADPPYYAASWAHAPPPARDCPLYLRLAALLI